MALVTLKTPTGDLEITPKPDELDMVLTELLRRHNLPLNTRCGQRGTCDSCRITLEQGSVKTIKKSTEEAEHISEPGATFRACQYRLGNYGTPTSAVTLSIPQRAITAYKPQVLDHFKINTTRAADPLLPDDFDSIDIDSPLGVAIDIGTTTVAVILVDLATGQVLAKASDFNQQMHLGDDVLTRINLCLNDKSLIDRMQEAIVNDTISPLIAQTLDAAGQSHEKIASLTVAANTTMLHLLMAEDPSAMGIAPFTPTFIEHQITTLKTLEYRQTNAEPVMPKKSKRPSPQVHLLPSAAAYVGADLTAGVVATNLLFNHETAMLVDVGTNGEIILKHEDKLYGCATAAGPAFEGSKLIDGIRAGDGAISHICFERDPFNVRYQLIGQDGWFDDQHKPNELPVGLCGSAYVDFMAEGIRSGLLLPGGRYDKEQLIQWGTDRLDTELKKCMGPCFRIAFGKGREPMVISEADIASLLQAKAAIAAGILTLLDKVGLIPADVQTLHLAGGFGMHLRLESAVGCGLLPGFEPEQITLVGNSALAGAYMGLIDRHAIEEMADAAGRMEVLELNLEPAFQDHYIDQLMLPVLGV